MMRRITRILLVATLGLAVSACGAALVAEAIRKSSEKDDPDADKPVVEVRVQDGVASTTDAPSVSAKPLRFSFRVNGNGVKLSALVIGPIRPGEDELTLIGIERNYVVLGIEPTDAPVSVAEFSALSGNPTSNNALDQFIEGFVAGTYRIVLRGIDEQDRVASDVHEWVFAP